MTRRLRRAGFAVVLACLALLAAATAWSGWNSVAALREQSVIADLDVGRDRALPPNPSTRLISARAAWLLAHDRIEEAEALGPAILRDGNRREVAVWYYNLANARLRTGFDLVGLNRLDDATPQVRLAKNAYRAALAADPLFFDAKVNLEIATRLDRDFPRVGDEGEEDPGNQPKNLWTELPGLPKGMP